MIGDHLSTASIPDPDLIIRTSGEYRISNFLLWQLAYSELYITELYWPILDEMNCTRRYIHSKKEIEDLGKCAKKIKTK